MHASASQLALVLLLIGRKGGANLLSQSHRVESAKPITFQHSNENRSKMPSLVRAKAGNIQYIQYTLLGHHKNKRNSPSQACAIAIVFHFFPRKKKVVKEDGVNEKAYISAFESVSPVCSHRRYYQQHFSDICTCL